MHLFCLYFQFSFHLWRLIIRLLYCIKEYDEIARYGFNRNIHCKNILLTQILITWYFIKNLMMVGMDN